MNFKGMTVKEIQDYAERTGDRDAYPRYLEEVARERDAEAQPLLDDLANFGLQFDSIDQLPNAPENTFALAITRMVDFIDVFKDEVNHLFLALALSRDEGRGFVAKPMMRRFSKIEPDNYDARFQAAKAIRATAEIDDLEEIENLILEPDVHISSRREFLSAITKLQKSRIIPLLGKCLQMDEEETVLEALKRLSRYKQIPDEVSATVRKLQSHPSPKVQKLANKLKLS